MSRPYPPAAALLAHVRAAEAMYELQRVELIYDGSDGDATRALFTELQGYGVSGHLAVALFRALKCCARAAGAVGHYADLAVGRKYWALGQLALLLCEDTTGVAFGWDSNPAHEKLPWVLYVDLPQGQVGFRAITKGQGPMYAGVPVVNGTEPEIPERVLAFVNSVLHPVTEKGSEPEPQKKSVVARARISRRGTGGSDRVQRGR